MRAALPLFACLGLLACEARSTDPKSKEQAVAKLPTPVAPARAATTTAAVTGPGKGKAGGSSSERKRVVPQPATPGRGGTALGKPDQLQPPAEPSRPASPETLPGSPLGEGSGAAPSSEGQVPTTGAKTPADGATSTGIQASPPAATSPSEAPEPALLASPVLSTYRVVAPARDAGAVEGTAGWQGGLPPPRSVPLPEGPAECGAQLQVPRVSVDGSQHVTGVLVRLLGMKEGRVQPKSERHPKLSISGCLATPKTLVVPIGGRLEIENRDNVSHQIRASFAGKTLFETTVEANAKRVSPRFKKAGFVTIGGGKGRSWLQAYVFVSPNPYVAVTDSDGPFRISGIVPNKTYSVEAWHPPLEPGAPPIVRRSEVDVPYWDTARLHFDLAKP